MSVSVGMDEIWSWNFEPALSSVVLVLATGASNSLHVEQGVLGSSAAVSQQDFWGRVSVFVWQLLLFFDAVVLQWLQ